MWLTLAVGLIRISRWLPCWRHGHCWLHDMPD